jgi:hypothetical protein
MDAMTWILVLNAMCIVESNNDPDAYNEAEGAVGVLQIRQCYLDDVNEYADTSWTLQDCRNVTVSRWVVRTYAKRYKLTTPEAVARGHNSGPNWRNKKHLTDAYWAKVRRQMVKLGWKGD